MTLHADDFLKGLDDNQTMAASSINGPVRIIAGAGAGKTRTITHRIAYACASHEWNPHQTLAVTFSVRAAEEMCSRLSRLGVRGVETSTFHSAALKQLRSSWYTLSELYFPQVVTDARTIADNALRRVTGVDEHEDNELRAVLDEINWAKVSLISPSDYVRICASEGREIPLDLEAERMADVMSAFEDEKTIRNEIDFNDILLMTSHILENFEDEAKAIRQSVKWLTVDEYQDVSPLQHRLMTLWMGQKNDNVCVVGDPAQTIYSFAGATSYYLRTFIDEFSTNSKDIRLDTDYRSTKHIVNKANKILQASPVRSDYLVLKSVQSDGRVGARVQQIRFKTDEEEAQAVVRHISQLMSEGVAAKDIAILMRINAQNKPIVAALKANVIPFRLRTEYGWNTASLPKDIEFTADAADKGMSTVATSEAQTTDTAVAARAQVLAETLGENRALGAVSISTIHAAKGLEWKHVFVIGCYEGMLPYGSPEPGEQLEEERRLMYVAITRAEECAYLSYAQFKDATFTGIQREPSRFLI